ncbi:MAG TPA: hypothetical protein PKB02_18460 [Anaerohalosphaeraceae bacterium]|nr:hypothetical protein [Anaerohalosphaeraceae bacterium]
MSENFNDNNGKVLLENSLQQQPGIKEYMDVYCRYEAIEDCRKYYSTYLDSQYSISVSNSSYSLPQ